MIIKRFKQTQRFRVCIGAVSFYAPSKQIRNGVGDFGVCNAATQKALDSLEYTRSCGGVLSNTVGQSGTWEGMQVQLNLA